MILYCIVIQNRLSTSEGCGKTKVENASKLLRIRYEKLYCKDKIVPKPRIATANKIQGVLSN